MYHFGASLPLKTSTKCFKYLQRSLVASQKSQHFSQSDGHVLELIKRDWVTWITWNATLHYTPTLPTLAKSAWFLQRRRKKGLPVPPGNPRRGEISRDLHRTQSVKEDAAATQFFKKGDPFGLLGSMSPKTANIWNISHRIHVCYIWQHLPSIYPKC